jgi:serine acetyltransferase
LGYVREERRKRTRIEIGNDVWIGQNAIILSGVNKIGDGAVIGAGSIVTKDVPDFAIVAGNPAKVIRCRFDEAVIRKLKEERWWDRDIEELKDNIDDFCRPIEMAKNTGCREGSNRV